MKKKISLIIAAALLLSGCNGNTTAEAASGTTISEETVTNATTTTSAAATTEITTTTPETTTAEEIPDPAEEIPDPAEELPRMDGSTSAIPLEAGLKAELLGVTYNDAKELVSHTKTHESFERLLNGETDLIFSVPISEEQQKMADEAGVTLNVVPVAKEGFVFVVNADNPVDFLTTQQIKDIYSGKITNWSELGGKDLPILAYQRNTDSGSQNYMTEFMGDTPLKEPESKYISTGMGGLMDAIATYDNSEGAIGYSVYSYAAQMYANANQVKFIAVDGTAPTKATMADESYPLSSCTYIIYPDTADEKTMEFINWAVSDEGQNAVLKSGYLPVNGMEIPDSYLPYEAVGTGSPKPTDYTPDTEYSLPRHLHYNSGIKLSGYLHNEENYYELDCLKDTELQNRINADIREASDYLKQFYDEKYLNNVWSDAPLGLVDAIAVSASCRNGYLSVLLYYSDTSVENDDPMAYSYEFSYDYAVSLNYDLFTGEKIEKFSDLFYEGADFVPALNNILSDFVNTEYLPSTGVAQKTDFSGLLGTPEVFTIDRIILPKDNAYFYDSPYLKYTYDESIYDLMVVGEYRDMTELFSAEDSTYNSKYNEWEIDYFVEKGVYIPYVKKSRYNTDEEVKERNELFYKAYTTAAELFKTQFGYDFESYEGPFRLRMGKRGGAYYLTTGFAAAEYMVWLDAENLEPLSISDILGEGWLDYAADGIKTASAYSLIHYTEPDTDGDYSEYDNLLTALIMYEIEENTWRFEEVSIPVEEVNTKYISSEHVHLS